MVTNKWLFAFGRAVKVGQYSVGNNRLGYSTLQDHGTQCAAKNSFTFRSFTHNRTFGKASTLFTIESKKNLSSATGSVANQAQLMWKRISLIHSYKGFTGPLVHKVKYSSFDNNRPTFSKLQEYGRYSMLCLSLGSRSFLHYHYLKKESMFAYGHLRKSVYFKLLFSSSANRSAGYHAQRALKRLSKLCSYRGHPSPSINKITCTMSLALTRFNIIPSILALIGGELAFSKIAYADGEYFSYGDNLYTRAQEGHIYITSLIISVLEFFILLIRTVYLAFLFSPTIIMAPFADTSETKYRKTSNTSSYDYIY